jgi:hypothetical protein
VRWAALPVRCRHRLDFCRLHLLACQRLAMERTLYQILQILSLMVRDSPHFIVPFRGSAANLIWPVLANK